MHLLQEVPLPFCLVGGELALGGRRLALAIVGARQEVGVLLQRRLGVLGLAPQIGAEEAIGVGEGIEGGLRGGRLGSRVLRDASVIPSLGITKDEQPATSHCPANDNLASPLNGEIRRHLLAADRHNPRSHEAGPCQRLLSYLHSVHETALAGTHHNAPKPSSMDCP